MLCNKIKHRNSLDVVRPAFCVDRLLPTVRELNVAAPILGGRQPAGRCRDVTAEYIIHMQR